MLPHAVCLPLPSRKNLLLRFWFRHRSCMSDTLQSARLLAHISCQMFSIFLCMFCGALASRPNLDHLCGSVCNYSAYLVKETMLDAESWAKRAGLWYKGVWGNPQVRLEGKLRLSLWSLSPPSPFLLPAWLAATLRWAVFVPLGENLYAYCTWTLDK